MWENTTLGDKKMVDMLVDYLLCHKFLITPPNDFMLCYVLSVKLLAGEVVFDARHALNNDTLRGYLSLACSFGVSKTNR